MATKLGSNNPFPSVLIVEQGATPTTPAAGYQRLFARTSDGHLCTVDDAGTVSDLQGASSGGSRQFGITLDGGGVAITTGVKGDWRAVVGGTITKVTVLADQSGSIVIDVWKDSFANYPPTVADTITASAKPTLSSATKAEDSTLTGWTKTFSAGDTFRFNVDSASTVTRVTLTIEYTPS